MSKAVSARGNAQKGREIRSQGYKSLLDKHKDVERRFIELYKNGGTMTSIRMTLVKEFPKVADMKEIPSTVQLTNYAKKNLTTTMTVSLYAPDYDQLLKEWDTVKQAFELCKTAHNMFEQAVKAKASFRIVDGWYKNCMAANKHFEEILKMRGIYGLNDDASKTIINNTQINNYGTKEESKEMMYDIEVSEAEYKRLRKQQESLLIEGGIGARTVIT